MKLNKLIIGFLVISLLGLFLPWYSYNQGEGYSRGLEFFNGGIGIGFIGAFMITFMNDKSLLKRFVHLGLMLLISLSGIYPLVTTSSMNISINISTIGLGFYITVIGSLIASVLFLINWKHN